MSVEFFWISLGLVIVLLLESIAKRSEPWAIPAAFVYITVAGWYLVEPFYTPEDFDAFSTSTINSAFICVTLFLVYFRILLFLLKQKQIAKRGSTGVQQLPADKILYYAAILWGALLVIGVWRLSGDWLYALFPIDARSGRGDMWARAGGADAGATGFLVSTGGYLYLLCLATFGMLLPLLKRFHSVVLALALIGLTWPYAFLSGTRNLVLATVMPGVLSFLIYGRAPLLGKAAIGGGAFLFIEYFFRLVVEYRNVGFVGAFGSDVSGVKHLGLNMASEMCYIVDFLNTGKIKLDLGANYVAQALNGVPRALWPEKPMIGIDYAIARGFGGADNDQGVFATVTVGMIGQGVMAFGSLLGPISSAAIMVGWVLILARLRAQGTVLRSILFLLGLGLTFNLGRDITLLVLWPFVFGFVTVKMIEARSRRRVAVGR